jgi:hypothetical protein
MRNPVTFVANLGVQISHLLTIRKRRRSRYVSAVSRAYLSRKLTRPLPTKERGHVAHGPRCPHLHASAVEGSGAKRPVAKGGARVVGTDALRISPVVQVSSGGQECEQDSEDNPNINAHQSSPAA